MSARTASGEPLKVNVGTRINADVFAKLKALADSEQRTVSQIVAFAVTEYLQRRDAEAGKRKR